MAASDQARPFVAIRPWLRAGLLRHISPTASRILFLMVDYCGTDGYSCPSAETLSKKSGHARKVIYGAQKELVAIGVLERKEGAAGRIQHRLGRRNPRQVYYWIGPCDDRVLQRLRDLDQKKAARRSGNAERFAKVSQAEEHLGEVKMSQTQEQLNGSSCSCECPNDVPADALHDVPIAGTLRVFRPEYSDQSLFQNQPPRPYPGEPSETGATSPENARLNGQTNGVRTETEKTALEGKSGETDEHSGWYSTDGTSEVLKAAQALRFGALLRNVKKNFGPAVAAEAEALAR